MASQSAWSLVYVLLRRTTAFNAGENSFFGIALLFSPLCLDCVHSSQICHTPRLRLPREFTPRAIPLRPSGDTWRSHFPPCSPQDACCTWDKSASPRHILVDPGRSWQVVLPSLLTASAPVPSEVACFSRGQRILRLSHFRASQPAALLYHPSNPSRTRSIGWCLRSVLCQRRSFDLRGRRTQHLSPLLLRAY
jgi:hypothetical protein